ncbi:MAG: ABC transporter permease [Oscillospiraceae bacterium]|nr:ABC transporter permease [Oscillospiraceae bacterium]MDD6855658.1 ABC transporter permease [Oscillospiraceae bacterium]
MNGKKLGAGLRGLLNCLIPILLAFLVGGIVIAVIGENPLNTYWVLLQKSLFTKVGFQNTLHYAGPMILTGLAIAVTFKANIYNMGVEGSLLLGAFFAGILGSRMTGNPFVVKLVCLAVGVLCGMAYSLVPALLKAKLRADEMVVTLMLNYALAKVLEFLTTGIFRDNGSGYVCTPMVSESAMFSRIFGKSRLTAFFFIVVAIWIVMTLYMRRGRLGYEIKAMGMNAEFAEATGMNVGKKIILLMLLSGALAGFAGAGWMMEDQYRYTLTFSGNPGLGWDGMLIALMGGHNPVGIFIASIFYAALKTGSDKINMYTNVPKEIVALIQALIVLFLAVKFIDGRFHLFERLKGKKGKESKTCS